MKKALALLVMMAVLLGTAGAMAASDPVEAFGLPEGGPLTVTLPEMMKRAVDGTYAPYEVAWEAVPGTHEYIAGVLMAVKSVEGYTYWKVAEGYVHNGTVKDGKGVEHSVKAAFFDSIQLDGDATGVDIAPILNLFVLDRGDVFDGFYMLITVVPEDGAPVTQAVALGAA